MTASTVQQENGLLSCPSPPVFVCVVACCCTAFNLILFLIQISLKHRPGTPIMAELRKKEYSRFSRALSLSISVNTIPFPPPYRASLSGNKVEVFVFVHLLGIVLFPVIHWSDTVKENLDFSHGCRWPLFLKTNTSSFNATRAAFHFHQYDTMCFGKTSTVSDDTPSGLITWLPDKCRKWIQRVQY